MNRLRIILALSIVALGAAALWAWQSKSEPAESTVAGAPPAAPVEPSPFPTLKQGVASDPATTRTPAVEPPAVPASSDIEPAVTSAPVDPPNVDRPEPAQQKFARGAHVEPDQN